jgi:hypothetical protein
VNTTFWGLKESSAREQIHTIFPMSMQADMMVLSPTLAPPVLGRTPEPDSLPEGLRVLMVEDESQVGLLIKKMLERLLCKSFGWRELQ